MLCRPVLVGYDGLAHPTAHLQHHHSEISCMARGSAVSISLRKVPLLMELRAHPSAAYQRNQLRSTVDSTSANETALQDGILTEVSGPRTPLQATIRLPGGSVRAVEAYWRNWYKGENNTCVSVYGLQLKMLQPSRFHLSRSGPLDHPCSCTH